MQQDHNLDSQSASSLASNRYQNQSHRSWRSALSFNSPSKQALSLILILFLVLAIFNWIFISYNFPVNPSNIKPVTSLQQQPPLNDHVANIQQSSKPVPVRHSQPSRKKHSQASPVDRLPKVFWIYTEKEVEAEPFQQQIYLHYLRDTVAKFGYEVKLVNSWNAYDYLNENTIARISIAMQKSKVDQPIHALLKIALLIENGGVMMNQFDYGFAGSSFEWIEKMFNSRMKNYESLYGCKPTKSYVYMFVEPGSGILQKRYSDSFIAAVPGSLLLTEAFHLIINFVLTGSLPWHPEIVQTDPETGVGHIDSLFQQSINIVINRYLIDFSPTQENLCNKYGLQLLKNNNTLDYANLAEDKKMLLLTTGDLEGEIQKAGGITQPSLLRGLNAGPIKQMAANLLENLVNNQHHTIQDYFPGSLLFKILNAPGNKEVFLDSLLEREVELCAIFAKELSKPEIDRALLHLLSHQTYKKWKQVMFVSDMNSLPKVEDPRLVFLPSSNIVRNIEIAVTQQCSPLSYAILLNPGQKFSSINALAEIAQAISPRGVVAAFITLDKHGTSKNPKQDDITLSRDEDGTLSASDQQYEVITNHMRIFSAQSFRAIPQFALHDAFGTYPKQKLVFLLPLLEMVSQDISDPAHLYLIKRYSKVWDVPRKAVLINHDIKIKNMVWQPFRKQELPQRMSAEYIKQTLTHFINWKIPFEKMVVLNKGEKFVSIETKKGKELIPKVIHQIWLGSKSMPPTKQYFLGKTKLMYPSFEIKLWSEDNITKQNFPLTYSLIKTLIALNQSNSLANAVDIARYELLYHEGGFWKDTGLNVLRPIFDKLTKYKLVAAVGSNFRYGGLSGTGFCGMTAGLQNMKRIIDFRNINRMRIYPSSRDYHPIDFTSFFLSKEQQDPEILLLSFESFYPASVRPGSDLCVKALADLDPQQSFEVNENGFVILSDCQDSYPGSFGVLHPQFATPRPIAHS